MSDNTILAAIERVRGTIADLATDVAEGSERTAKRLGGIEDGLATLTARMDHVTARMDQMTVRMDHIEIDMMKRINGQFDRILDAITANRNDGDATKGHVIYALQENLTLSQRITKLEEELRRPR